MVLGKEWFVQYERRTACSICAGKFGVISWKVSLLPHLLFPFPLSMLCSPFALLSPPAHFYYFTNETNAASLPSLWVRLHFYFIYYFPFFYFLTLTILKREVVCGDCSSYTEEVPTNEAKQQRVCQECTSQSGSSSSPPEWRERFCAIQSSILYLRHRPVLVFHLSIVSLHSFTHTNTGRTSEGRDTSREPGGL
jgi:hypothetical protein